MDKSEKLGALSLSQPGDPGRQLGVIALKAGGEERLEVVRRRVGDDDVGTGPHRLSHFVNAQAQPDHGDCS